MSIGAKDEVWNAAMRAAQHPAIPTDAQKEAGNYRKRHFWFHGLDVSIENLKGSRRHGVGAGGKRWSCIVPADYGYIKRTEGADGDHVDCYVGPHKDSHIVFVVDQQDPKTGRFDEHKCLLGFRSEAEARCVYDAGFGDGSGPERRRHMKTMSLSAFKDWVKRGGTRKPIGRIARADGGAVLHTGEIQSAVAGRTDHLPMHVPEGSYVVPAEEVAHLGEGNTQAGFKVLRRVFTGEPYAGDEGRPYNVTSGPYGSTNRAKGGKTGTVPIVAAGGEFVISPHDVKRVGDGDLDRGHRVLDAWIKRLRQEHIKTLRKLPGPAKN
jgi:hypothetical protein